MNCCFLTVETRTSAELPRCVLLKPGSVNSSTGLHLPDFQLHLPALSGTRRRGRIWFYINKGWCTDVTVLKKSCSPHLESLFINCRPFYSPWEFSSFILVGVYIPPQACVTEALQQLADQITDMERKHPDSLLIVLGDFNGANLSRQLPRYRQHVKCPTRDKNTLDHCFKAVVPNWSGFRTHHHLL